MEYAAALKIEEKLIHLLTALDGKTERLLSHYAESDRRLSDIERKISELLHFREKFLEWMAQYSRRLEDARVHQQESRVSFETVYCKLEDLDQDVRLLKAAVRDVDRRYEVLEKTEAQGLPPGRPKESGQTR